MTIAENIAVIREKIEKASRGRKVALVGVAKTKSSELVRQAVAAGIDAVAENYVQEIREKDAEGAYGNCPVHLIGHLQQNKVKYVVGRAGLIQSVDSEEILAAVGRRAVSLGTVQDVLLEVNIAGEESKTGMDELDRWALDRCEALIEKCLAAYERNEFWTVTYAVHNFCVVEMSNFYLDVLKDRLYCEKKDSLERRSGQTAMWNILDVMVRLLAPILAFTANEIWLSMPHRAADDVRHVCLNDMPAEHPAWKLDEAKAAYWADSLRLRDDVNKALELARAEKGIGKPLDAKVTIHVSDGAKDAVDKIRSQRFTALFIVSEAELCEGAGEGYQAQAFPGVSIEVTPSAAQKCPRCWTHSATVGSDSQYPQLCARCAAALK